MIKLRVVGIINQYAPGLAEMFYMLIEKDLVRVYREYS